MREFFGFGGYQRPIEGYMSWQHLTFVSALMAVMIFLAVFLGIRARRRDPDSRLKALAVAAILIDALEIFKIVILCFRDQSAETILYNLPLFLCSIQLITLPLAAFSKGLLQRAALDFVAVFGVLGAVLGTYAAGNIYGANPVLSFDCVISGITHTIAGFASLYILIAGLAHMEKREIPLTFLILCGFCGTAYVVNRIIDYNYMFLQKGDGTPYDILYNLVGGNAVLYPLGVWLLFILYISAFYGVAFVIRKRRRGR